jgi:hypothetical protein
MKACKYLGVAENRNIDHKNEEEKLKKEYVRRLRLILSTELSAKKQSAINWMIGSTSTKIYLWNY